VNPGHTTRAIRIPNAKAVDPQHKGSWVHRSGIIKL